MFKPQILFKILDYLVTTKVFQGFEIDPGRVIKPEKEVNPDVDRVTIPEMICDPRKYSRVMTLIFFLERGTS